MRFLSKLTLLCNVCFIITVIMQVGMRIGGHKKAAANTNGIVYLNALESSVVVLGTFAIILNLFFIVLFVARFTNKKFNNIQRWIVYFNMLLLPAQIYYFFLT